MRWACSQELHVCAQTMSDVLGCGSGSRVRLEHETKQIARRVRQSTASGEDDSRISIVVCVHVCVRFR